MISELEEEEKKIKQEIDKTFELYYSDKLTKDGFGEKYSPLEERLKQLKDQIPELQGEIDFLKIQYLSSDEVLSEAQDLYSRWLARADFFPLQGQPIVKLNNCWLVPTEE